MTSVTGKITSWFLPRVSVARVAGSTHKSARNTSNAKAVQHKKGSGENLQGQWFASKRWRQKHAWKTSKVLQSDCKVYRICPSRQPRSCHLTANDITFVGAEPVDVLCIRRLSENNFAKLFSESLRMHKTSTGSAPTKVMSLAVR